MLPWQICEIGWIVTARWGTAAAEEKEEEKTVAAAVIIRNDHNWKEGAAAWKKLGDELSQRLMFSATLGAYFKSEIEIGINGKWSFKN